jgi:hypothetical protein
MIATIAVIWFAIHLYRSAYEFGAGRSKISVLKFWLKFFGVILAVACWQWIFASLEFSARYPSGANIFSVVVPIVLGAALLTIVIIAPSAAFGWYRGRRTKGPIFNKPALKNYSRDPWKIYQDGGTVYRVNEVSGVKEISTPEGWKTPKE